jgi:hypothetical protein
MVNDSEVEATEATLPSQLEAERAEDAVDKKVLEERKRTEAARRIQSLQLMRARIREQLARSGNERYTQLLNLELQQIERDLEAIS